jgi:hypothetical protein
MPNGIFPEWLNINAGRAFPLAENASRLDSSGSVKLPDSLIVAAQISMTPDYAAGTFYVSRVGGFPDRVVVTISYLDADGISREIASVVALAVTHTTNTTYPFTGVNSDAVLLGSITLGDLSEAMQAVPGLTDFDATSTPFEVSALFVATPALKALEFYNGSTLIQSFTDIAVLRPGENIRLTRINDTTIRIDAIAGENLVSPAECENAEPVPPCIRTINGVAPDENGNFQLEGGSCLDINVQVGTITITDVCAKSCCGCDELEAIVQGLQAVEQQLITLRENSISTIQIQQTLITTLAAEA